jgi:hypothetical protein
MRGAGDRGQVTGDRGQGTGDRLQVTGDREGETPCRAICHIFLCFGKKRGPTAPCHLSHDPPADSDSRLGLSGGGGFIDRDPRLPPRDWGLFLFAIHIW